MNERIKLLADQARVLADEFQEQWKAGPSNEEFFQEKFAQLIVRECADICYDHSNAAGGVDTHFGYGYKDCGDDIKRNFGVEL
jgi:hypothetical protein